MRTLGLCVLLAGAAQEAASGNGSAPGLIVERTVHAVHIDLLGRRREYRRVETVRLRGNDLAIEDRTFAQRLIIRPDRRTIVKIDLAAGEYSEYTFDEVEAVRKAALDGIQACRDRVPGTAEERELAALLEGFDRYAEPPRVEVRARDGRREVILNGDRVRVSVEGEPAVRDAQGYWEALAAAGAFPPEALPRLRELGGFPSRATVRYVLFLERVVEQFEVSSARSGPVAPEEFDVPPGLKKVPLRGFEPAAERRPPKPARFQRSFKEDEAERPPEKKDSP
ncbi:MAG TPA: hypothetical protein VNO22_06875 [Planctomycetota bacterium]|nr:hypothetical protein [Planctomycetota bacterium]